VPTGPIYRELAALGGIIERVGEVGQYTGGPSEPQDQSKGQVAEDGHGGPHTMQWGWEKEKQRGRPAKEGGDNRIRLWTNSY
jgi:hypothetical protein